MLMCYSYAEKHLVELLFPVGEINSLHKLHMFTPCAVNKLELCLWFVTNTEKQTSLHLLLFPLSILFPWKRTIWLRSIPAALTASSRKTCLWNRFSYVHLFHNPDLWFFAFFCGIMILQLRPQLILIWSVLFQGIVPWKDSPTCLGSHVLMCSDQLTRWGVWCYSVWLGGLVFPQSATV